MHNKKIVGFSLHYFRNHEVLSRIIHVGFSGIDPAFQGKGLAPLLRKHLAKHFSNNSISGISARIEANNDASLKASLRGGFKIVKEPSDESGAYEIFMNLSGL